MFGIGTQEVLFIGLIILLFFGGKKIPELMKGLGKGVRSFKDGLNGTADAAPTNNATAAPKSDTANTNAASAAPKAE